MLSSLKCLLSHRAKQCCRLRGGLAEGGPPKLEWETKTLRRVNAEHQQEHVKQEHSLEKAYLVLLSVHTAQAE